MFGMGEYSGIMWSIGMSMQSDRFWRSVKKRASCKGRHKKVNRLRVKRAARLKKRK
jgi:hypothetical protein